MTEKAIAHGVNWQRREDRRKYVKKYKAAIRYCQICGMETDLTFHHVNPSEKKDNVSDMIRKIASYKAIDAEMRKCLLVCRDCHVEIHRKS